MQTLIVGGGIAGASVAYHLAKLGRRDIALIERHLLTSGTTWHAAGLIMQLRSSHALTELARYNVELYASLEAETGLATGFKQNGTLGVARTKDRLFETRRLAAIAASAGIEAHMISPREARDIYPAIDASILAGAIFVPGDGQTNPVDTTMSLIAGARQNGVQVYENTPAVHLELLPDGHYLVRTPAGDIDCETLVLACGLWTRDLALTLGLRIPLYACEHFYVVTEALDFVQPKLPVLRDTDGHCYIKEDAGKLLVGAFEPQGKPIAMADLPVDTPFIELAEDWDHFALPFGKAMELLPGLEQAGIAHFFNGPESFTPDLLFALGEAPGLPNCFVSAGYNSEGIEFNAGAGRALAEWIVQGEPSMDLAEVDIARFHPFQINRRYLHERTGEVLGQHYKMHWPHLQPESARPVRKSALHENWVARNASFGEGLGWERPMWFAQPGQATVNQYSHTRPNWFENTARECREARTGVVVFDQSSFGKHLLQGRDACPFLQRLCAGNIDVPVGKLLYTHMLNHHAGIEVDITVNRLAGDRFLLLTSATSQPRDWHWIEKHVAPGDCLSLVDVTSAWGVLSVQGPRARDLLAEVCAADLGNDAFPFATSRHIDIGFAPVIANRLTYIGELGFELIVPVEYAQGVCATLMQAGEAHGLVPAGYHALEHLRLERGYREFGLDITPADTPLEAGLSYCVDFDKPVEFLGRDALLRQRESGTRTKRLVLFKLDHPEPVLHGEEPIWLDGKVAGYLSSAAYGFSLGASVGMGYVHHPGGVNQSLLDHARFTIDVAGEQCAASASLRGFYDPTGARLR